MNERTLIGYIEEVARPDPAPGAGSVSAITGALGSALGEMVCAITLGNPRTAAGPELEAVTATLATMRAKLIELAREDESAYMRFRKAQALPKSTDIQKRARSEAMARTLAWAAEVPLRIAECSVTALEGLEPIAARGSKHALADVLTAAHILRASIEGALENVAVNLGMMKDRDAAAAFAARAGLIRARSAQAHRVVSRSARTRSH